MRFMSLKPIVLVATLGLLFAGVAIFAGGMISTHTNAVASGQAAKHVCLPPPPPTGTKPPVPAGLPSKGIGAIGPSQAPTCLPPCPPPQSASAGKGTLSLSESPCPSSPGKK